MTKDLSIHFVGRRARLMRRAGQAGRGIMAYSPVLKPRPSYAPWEGRTSIILTIFRWGKFPTHDKGPEPSEARPRQRCNAWLAGPPSLTE